MEMLQVSEIKGLVPESGVEPERLATRDFKSQGSPAATSKALNYKDPCGTIQQHFDPIQGTKSGTRISRLILTLLAILAGPLHAQSVYWNPVNSRGSGHEALIQFAVQSAAERTGMVVTYAGQTTAAECVANAITYRTASVAEWNLSGAVAGFTPAEFTGLHGFTFTCPYGGYTLLLSPHWDVDRETVMHELVCHGLRSGFAHLLYSAGALCRDGGNDSGLITWADAEFVRAAPAWPVPNAASWCHNELTNDWDLMIPQINGKRVRLNYDGIVSGSHQWTVAESLTQSNTKGCANNWTNQDGTATLNDIRGIADYASATFQPVGVSSWRLVSVTP